MKERTGIGELEEMVILIVASLDNDAYGVSVLKEYIENTGRNINISSIHTTLGRLEKKGFLRSHEGGATAERGGRRKRFFKVTAQGFQTITEIREIRNSLYNKIPKLSSQLGISYG